MRGEGGVGEGVVAGSVGALSVGEFPPTAPEQPERSVRDGIRGTSERRRT